MPTDRVVLEGDHETMTEDERLRHYRRGCRHEYCTVANRAYAREYYHAKLAAGLKEKRQRARPVRVSSVGTVRRIRGLVHAGWSPPKISQLAQIDESAIWFFLLTPSPTVTVDARKRLMKAYRRLRYETPPETRPEAEALAVRCRTIARHCGWHSIFEWTDIDSDPDPDGIK